MDKVVSSAHTKPSPGSPTGTGSAWSASSACAAYRASIDAVTLTPAGRADLEVISPALQRRRLGLGILLKDKRIRRIIASMSGRTEFERQYPPRRLGSS